MQKKSSQMFKKLLKEKIILKNFPSKFNVVVAPVPQHWQKEMKENININNRQKKKKEKNYHGFVNRSQCKCFVQCPVQYVPSFLRENLPIGTL